MAFLLSFVIPVLLISNQEIVKTIGVAGVLFAPIIIVFLPALIYLMAENNY
jgi:hypothetical protein